jgi:hypothetical protein
MDIPINAEVRCTDGPCGQATYVLVNPAIDEITHVIVRENNELEIERLVPIAEVLKTTHDKIFLRCSRNDVAAMNKFADYEYLAGVEPYYIYTPGEYMMWPYTVPIMPPPLVHLHIPAGELAIRRGATVQATDGMVGHVDEFVIDPANSHITHLVLREGHIWGQKDVVIPLEQIDHIDDQEGTVYLKLDRHGVEVLPAIPIKQWRRQN